MGQLKPLPFDELLKLIERCKFCDKPTDGFSSTLLYYICEDCRNDKRCLRWVAIESLAQMKIAMDNSARAFGAVRVTDRQAIRKEIEQWWDRNETKPERASSMKPNKLKTEAPPKPKPGPNKLAPKEGKCPK